MLFCASSFAGLMCAEAMSADATRVSTTVITTVYALAMVLVTGLRTGRASATEADGSFDALFDSPHDADGADSCGGAGSPAVRGPAGAAAGPAASPVEQRRAAIEERCAQLAHSCGLTPRETQILTYLAEGHGSGYIGEALYISPNTVRTHVHNIYRKLEVASREEVLELVKR